MNNLLTLHAPIKYIHQRWDGSPTNAYDPFGGVTIAYQKVTDDKYHVAYARCNDHDHYCKRIGRNISSGRLLSGDCYEISIPKDGDRYTEIVRLVNLKIRRQMYDAGASHYPFPNHE